MAEITVEQFRKHIAQIKVIFADGFQLADISKLIEEAMQIAEVYKDTAAMTGEERKALTLRLIDGALTEVTLPWWAPRFAVRWVASTFAPGVVESIVKATKGDIKVNA